MCLGIRGLSSGKRVFSAIDSVQRGTRVLGSVLEAGRPKGSDVMGALAAAGGPGDPPSQVGSACLDLSTPSELDCGPQVGHGELGLVSTGLVRMGLVRCCSPKKVKVNNMVRHCRQQVLISPFRSLIVNWDLPSSPVVKTLSFYCRLYGFHPGWGTKIPHAM